ncbi:MAG: porin family protein [Mediterranea sp.]|nr:porin family protein [Mediterranea sp.]
MKKILSVFAVIACCLVATPAQAQLLKFGLKGGVNLSEINWKSFNANKDNTTGFYVGPMVELTIPILGLGVDGAVMYSQRGNTKLMVDNNEVGIKQEGLEVPIHLKYTFGLGSTFGIFIAAGPDFFFNFKENKMDNPENWDIWKDKKTQVGLNLGAGIKLFKHLQVGVNYQLPLGDSFTFKKATEAAGDLIEGKMKTETWQVSAAYIF